MRHRFFADQIKLIFFTGVYCWGDQEPRHFIEKYKDKEFFDENRDIYIQLPGGRKKYQIFAAVAFDDRYLMSTYAFTYDEDFNKYISELKACMEGNVDESIDVKFGDKIITLSTCIDEYPDQRWLVNAVLVDEEWY